MSWGYVQYDYPNSILLHKFVIWLDKAANVYFAIKENDIFSWAYPHAHTTSVAFFINPKLAVHFIRFKNTINQIPFKANG